MKNFFSCYVVQAQGLLPLESSLSSQNGIFGLTSCSFMLMFMRV